jgi:glycosyltransferase involved in cell wall biosynthesis
LRQKKITSQLLETFEEKLMGLETKFKTPIEKIQKKQGELSRKSVWELSKKVFDQADLIIAPSFTIEKELKKYEIKNPVIRISNGLELGMFKKKKQYRKKIRKFLHLGRIGFEKKIDIVIKAMSIVVIKYPDVKLSIVGNGPAMESLKLLVGKLNLDNNIEFLGFIPRKKICSIYRKHDVFVTASEMETQGLVLLEAMACGLPVIGVKVLAIPDVVQNNITGYCVKKRDFTAMANTMIKFIENPHLIKKMGGNARKEAEKHDINKVMDKMEKCYLRFI